MMIENERSKAPFYYIVFESLITVAMYFYVPQTIAFFTSIFLSTFMYLYASCKNPGYVDQSPFAIEDQNVNIQMQIQRFQGTIRKSEIDKIQDKSSDDEKEDNYVGIIGQLKKYVRKSQSFRSKSLKSKETSLTNSQPKSNQKSQGSNQNSPTTVNKTEDQEQEGAQQASTQTLNFQTQNDQQEKQQKEDSIQIHGNTEQNNPLDLLYVNDMSPNYMSAQGSQFDLSELQSENDPGSNNSPKSFRFEDKNQNNPIQAFAEVLIQNTYQKQNQKLQQEPQQKNFKQNQEVIDETQAASERTAVSYGLGGISSFIIQCEIENEQKVQTELNTDVSLIQENKQISNYQCGKNLDTDDLVMQQSPEKQQTQKQSNEQNVLRNSQNNASVSSSLEFSENSLQNYRQSSNSNNSSSSEQVERPFLKQRKKNQTLSPFYIINEDEEGDYSQQENRVSGISNKEESKENTSKAKQNSSENKENKNQVSSKQENAQSARDSSNLSYISADFNDSHGNIQIRDINKRISLDSNINQERESVESEKKQHQNQQRKQRDSLSPKKLSQSNLIIVENRYCTVCNLEQPTRAKHCRECGRCVATHDHHCP